MKYNKIYFFEFYFIVLNYDIVMSKNFNICIGYELVFVIF